MSSWLIVNNYYYYVVSIHRQLHAVVIISHRYDEWFDIKWFDINHVRQFHCVGAQRRRWRRFDASNHRSYRRSRTGRLRDRRRTGAAAAFSPQFIATPENRRRVSDVFDFIRRQQQQRLGQQRIPSVS